jgi:hypothetical protein
MTKTLCVLLISLCLSVAAHGQVSVDEQKVDAFAHAIASAEGFGVRRAIPTRYHNPGDLKCNPRKAGFHFEGMRGVGKGGHVIFRSDVAGWAALRSQIGMIVDGRSRNFDTDMTINQMGRVYARNWQRWANSVSRQLGVPPTTTLRAYLQTKFPELVPFTPAVPVLETAN